MVKRRQPGKPKDSESASGDFPGFVPPRKRRDNRQLTGKPNDSTAEGRVTRSMSNKGEKSNGSNARSHGLVTQPGRNNLKKGRGKKRARSRNKRTSDGSLYAKNERKKSHETADAMEVDSSETAMECSPQKRQTTEDNVASSQMVLPWHSPRRHVPDECERDMLATVIRWGATERGMMKDQPAFRLKQIQHKCRSVGMELLQALSLRRHHMKLLNPGKPMVRLGLGKENDVRDSAALFENTVSLYLDKCGVKYHTEKEQKQHFLRNRKDGELMPPTPDFVLGQPVNLHENAWSVEKQHSINWIEVKQFYGASTIPHDNKCAVGRVLLTARKYVDLYGPGAMVFSYGCGETLARELLEVGVVALDADPVDMRKLEKHQRKWCANKSGEILP